MAIHLPGRRTPRSIGIVRALQLGDLVCATPALRALHAAYPHARLTLIGLPWAREFVQRYAYLHDFIEFPGWEGIPEREPDDGRLALFQAEAQLRAFDIGIQLHGDGRHMNGFMPHLRARRLAGFVPADQRPQSEWFVPYPEHLPEPLRLLRVPLRLGAAFRGAELDFPVTPENRADAERLLCDAGAGPGPYICIHPGGRAADRRWPAQRFAEVVEALAPRGYTFVLTGSASESEIARELTGRVETPVVDLTGQTSLGSLGALIEGAQLLIANDTGVSHVAAALGTPSVVVFTGSDPERWAPLRRSRHTVVETPQTTGDESAGGTAVAVLPQTSAVDDVVAAATRHLEESERAGARFARRW